MKIRKNSLIIKIVRKILMSIIKIIKWLKVKHKVFKYWRNKKIWMLIKLILINIIFYINKVKIKHIKN